MFDAIAPLTVRTYAGHIDIDEAMLAVGASKPAQLVSDEEAIMLLEAGAFPREAREAVAQVLMRRTRPVETQDPTLINKLKEYIKDFEEEKLTHPKP